MMQKVQRWSQPFCTCTKARARPSMPSTKVQRGLAHRHDVVDADFFFRARGRTTLRFVGLVLRVLGPDLRLHLLALPTTRATSGIAAKVCGSVCAAQPVTTILASGRSRASLRMRLARLPHGLGRHRAGVDDDGVVEPGRRRGVADHLGLVGVEPAAEGDDLDAHQADRREQRGIEAALEFERDRPGHQHVIVALAPLDHEVAARQRHGHACGRSCAAAPPRPRPRRPPSRRPWSGPRRAPRCAR